jgi:hypothetical protein
VCTNKGKRKQSEVSSDLEEDPDESNSPISLLGSRIGCGRLNTEVEDETDNKDIVFNELPNCIVGHRRK